MLSLVPWWHRRELDRFRGEMDRLFNRFFDLGPSDLGLEEGEWMPSVDVSETGKEVIVHAEIPGMDPKDIDISLSGNLLTLKGERKREEENKGESFHRIERSYGAFTRTIQLPADVNSNKVDATCKDGVLKVRMPKTKEESVRKIEVKTA
ncbi:MAG: Hsp20/alpha crystallin family protein [Deltaproteobacteria bacterium]|nr:Hsp20/alpha crystallin family protein [Deltaproteobacteria bacterium]